MTIAPLNVRFAHAEGFADWLPLWNYYNAFYGRTGATALPLDITQTTWSRFLDADEPMHAMVAERAGQLLGLVHFVFHRSTTRIAPICYLGDLFTTDTVRGQGVGRALIEAVYQHAQISGSTSVYWHTHETNSIAMRLYDKVAGKPGFVVYQNAV